MTKTAPKVTKGSAVHPRVHRATIKLGRDMALARRVRSLSTIDMAERMGVDRSTLRRLEQGDPGVSLNTFAMALHALGLMDRLEGLVDRATDDVGLLTAEDAVPKRIARSRPASTRRTPAGPLGQRAPNQRAGDGAPAGAMP
ncbi:hypothetical protein CKO19_01175 [Rhodovulum adriaticum]|nr:hypothetical protein [Rhodovulum adriaticum]